jgi:hypothetical protein
MTRRKAVSKAQDAVNMADKLLAQVDPEVLLCGALGAVATAGGITPPLTRLLMSIGGNVDLGSDIANKAGTAWYDVAQFGSPILFALGLSFGDNASTPAAKASQQAVIAAGAMEAMMVMAFMKNPAAMEMLSKLGGMASKAL